MGDRLLRRDRGHGGAVERAERAARRRQNDALDGVHALGLERLEDRIVLRIHRQQGGARAVDLGHHERAGRDQRLLVGEGDVAAAPDSGQRRRQTGGTDDRDHDPVRRPVGRLDNRSGAGRGLDACPSQGGAQRRVLGLVGNDGQLGADADGLLGQALGTAMRRQGFDCEGLGRALDQVQGVAADGAGRPQHGDPPRCGRGAGAPAGLWQWRHQTQFIPPWSCASDPCLLAHAGVRRHRCASRRPHPGAGRSGYGCRNQCKSLD